MSTHPRRLPQMLLVGMSHNPGGTELFIMSVLRSLKNDFEIWVLATEDQIAFEEEIVNEGATIARVTSREKNPVRYLSELRELFREQDFHVVWLNQSSLSTIGPLLVGWQQRVPLRLVHSHQSQNIGSAVTAVLHNSKKPLVNRIGTHRLACSDKAATWFFSDREYTFVPNAFPVERFTFSSDVRTQMREELGLGENTLAVVHVASFLPYKNHVFTLEILQELVDQNGDVRLLYCGDGPGRVEMETLAHERGLTGHTQFLGVRSDVDRILQAADVSILPSISEGLPYTALEAQAAQLPTLLSDAVSEQTAVTEFAEFIPLSAGAGHWAGEIRSAMGGARLDGENPLRGGPFDITTFRTTLLQVIGSAQQAR